MNTQPLRKTKRLGGGTGRHAGLRNQCPKRAGSTPARAIHGAVVEQVDTADLKSVAATACGFDSRLR